MYSLEIGFYASIQRAFYTTKEAADEQLALLKPKIGHHYYGNKDGEPHHTIACPEGDIVVSIEKVESVRVIDHDVHYEITKPLTDRNEQISLEAEIRRRKALANLPQTT